MAVNVEKGYYEPTSSFITFIKYDKTKFQDESKIDEILEKIRKHEEYKIPESIK